jgi:hypothetical protein
MFDYLQCGDILTSGTLFDYLRCGDILTSGTLCFVTFSVETFLPQEHYV